MRRRADGRRRVHWLALAVNVAMAMAGIGLPLGAIVMAGLDGSIAETFSLVDEMFPIVVTWAGALVALGTGYRLTAPPDCLPGENGEPPEPCGTRWYHWASLRALLFGGLASVTVLFAARVWSDWEGRRVWEAYRVEAGQRGVVFDTEKLMPPSVPDAENFAAIPLFRPFHAGTPEWERHRTNRVAGATATPVEIRDPGAKPLPSTEGDWRLGQRPVLAEWQAHYRASTNFPKWPEPRTPAEDVLKALTRFDAEFAELRAAAGRPHARFNIQLTEDGISTLLTHLQAVKGVSSALLLKARAELAAGLPIDAQADAMLVLRLSDSIKTEPFLISHLVRLALLRAALAVLWEGLAGHRWSAAQLAAFQEKLAELNLPGEHRFALAGERTLGNRIIHYLIRKPEMLEQFIYGFSNRPVASGAYSARIIPSGWYQRELVNYHIGFDDYVSPTVPSAAGEFDAGKVRSLEERMKRDIGREKAPFKAILHHQVLKILLLPALGTASQRTAEGQAFTRLALAACALERHRLSHGSYPESLAQVAAEFGLIPADPMNGRPFRYERTADGRFRLWSIGWNSTDDDGQVAFRKSKKREVDWANGDWVWPVQVQ